MCCFNGFAENRVWERHVSRSKNARASQTCRVFPFTFHLLRLWEALGDSGKLLEALESFAGFARFCEALGGFGRLACFGKLLVRFGRPWEALDSA